MFNNNTNGYSLSDIAAATGNHGNIFGFNGDGAWIFFLFILMLPLSILIFQMQKSLVVIHKRIFYKH